MRGGNYFLQIDPIISRPTECHFAGWTSDTHRLQQEGWQFSCQQDMPNYGIRLAMKHAEHKICAISNIVSYDLARDFPGAVRFDFRHLCADIIIHEPVALNLFRPVDMEPRWRESIEIKHLSQVDMFAPALTRTQEIIIPDENVEELMERILKLQQPARERRIIEAVKKEHGYGPEMVFHAQILSLKEAA